MFSSNRKRQTPSDHSIKDQVHWCPLPARLVEHAQTVARVMFSCQVYGLMVMGCCVTAARVKALLVAHASFRDVRKLQRREHIQRDAYGRYI
jgi:hypothetical protein